jgi:hypothetical protein
MSFVAICKGFVPCKVLTALDAAVMSSAARIATRNRRVERLVAMLPIRFAVTRTMLASSVAVWERRYVAPAYSVCQIDMTAGGYRG